MGFSGSMLRNAVKHRFKSFIIHEESLVFINFYEESLVFKTTRNLSYLQNHEESLVSLTHNSREVTRIIRSLLYLKVKAYEESLVSIIT